jgi:hypothetical protein
MGKVKNSWPTAFKGTKTRRSGITEEIENI